MHLTSALLLLFRLGFAAAAPQIIPAPSAADIFTPPEVVSASFSGNGCPQGTTEVSNSSLWEHFSFDLPRFNAKFGPSSSVTERSVNCQAHVNFGRAAAGWQFALKDHWSKGYFEADGVGVKLTQYVTQYYSQNAADTATIVNSVPSTNSTISKSLNLHTRIPRDVLIWSPCNGAGILNVNFRVAFTGATDNVTAYYGGSRNRPVREQWGWTWRRC